MIEIKPYEKELVRDFIYTGTEKNFSNEQIIPMLEFYNKLGSVYIGSIENRIIGIGGVYPLWKNTGSCFLLLNKETVNYKKSIFKYLLEYMNMLIKKYEIKVLIVECVDNSLEAHRLIEHLGFIKDKEVKMSMYEKIGV